MKELQYLSKGVQVFSQIVMSVINLKLDLNELARFQTVYGITSLTECKKGRRILKQVQSKILLLPNPYLRGSTRNEKKTHNTVVNY